jgi:O-antigen ligase
LSAYFQLNEAHNGFLETYLNSGVIGLILLLLAILFAARWVKRAAVTGAPFGAFRLAILVTALFYAMSEAIFNRLTLMWFILLLALIEHSARWRGINNRTKQLRAASSDPAHAELFCRRPVRRDAVLGMKTGR